MKKAVFFTAILAFLLLAGCETKSYTVVIKNSRETTKKAVKYTFNDSTVSLDYNDSNIYEVKPYTQPPVIIDPDQSESDQSKKKTAVINYNTTTGDYTFVDK